MTGQSKVFSAITLAAIVTLSTIIIGVPFSASVVTAQSTIVVDGDGTGDYTNIQEAINNANSGDTIVVNKSTGYGPIVISRDSNPSNLTIRAADGSTPTISSTASNGEPTVAVDQNNITIEGFAIERSGSTSTVAETVRVAASNVTLIDNTYELTGGANDAGINVLTDASGASGASNPTSAISGISIEGGEIITDDTSQTGLLVANNSMPGFKTGAVTVTDVTFTAKSGGVHLYELGTGDTDAISATATFENNDFNGGAAVPDTIGSGETVGGFSLEDVITSTVQDAIDVAGADATIDVAGGTYDESVVISRDADPSGLTIQKAAGAGSKPTIVHSADNGEPTIAVDQDDITIEGFVINRSGSASTVAQAVRVAGNNTVLGSNIFNVTGPNDAAVGVLTDSSGAAGNPSFTGEIASVTISGGEVITSDSTQTGLLVADTGSASFAAGAVTASGVTFVSNGDGTHVYELGTGETDAIDTVATFGNNDFVGGAAVPDTVSDDATVGSFSVEGVIAGTIQGAVDVAGTGATIDVAAGTYNESVTISTADVSLQGPNTGVAGYGASRSNEATVTDKNGRLVIDASNVEINGFNFEFDKSAIQSKSGNDNLIINNRFELTGSTSNQYAVRVGGGSPGTDVRNNLFANIVSSDGTGGDNADGVVVTDPRGTTIANNNFSSVDTGVNVGDQGPVAGTLVVKDNAFTDITQFGAVVLNNKDAGLDANVTNNTIESSRTGVLVFAGNANSKIKINENNIESDVGTGVSENDIAGTVNATRNWWGAPSGPSGQGDGSGSAVDANVDFEPFYTDATRQTLRVKVSDPSVQNASQASVGGDRSATVTVSGKDIQSTTVTLPSGSGARSVTVGEASSPSGNAQGTEPENDVATYFDISADQTVDESVDISVIVKTSTLSNAGIATEDAVILHYVDGAWTELETTSSVSGGTVTLSATATSLSPFAVGATAGGGGGGGTSGVLAIDDTSVTERLGTGPVQQVTVNFEEATSGTVEIKAVDDFPAGAPAIDQQVLARVDISPPRDAANAPGTVELTVSRTAVTDAGADPSELQIVRYNQNSGEIETLTTDVAGRDDQTVTVSADTPGFSVFGITVAEQGTVTAAQTATATPEPTATATQTAPEPPTDTPTAESTPTETAPETQTPTEGGGPGFGAIVAIVTLIAFALLAARRST